MPGSNSHQSHSEKYLTQAIAGFISLLLFTGVTFYSIFEVKKDKSWYLWAGIAAFLLLTGVYFLMSATVHKVKSDFNRRAKQREQHKTFMADN